MLKNETENPIRSFKGRGAQAFVRGALSAGEPLVTASAGNFGQALALAAVERGHPVTVFAAASASPVKLAAMERLGATVILGGDDFDAAKARGKAWAAARGVRFVEDGAEPAIAEGAGTIAVELQRQAAVDAVFVPIGNGALAAGVGAWYRHAAPEVRVVGVVAAAAPCMLLSLRARRVIETATAATIADGVAVRQPVPAALEVLYGVVDDVVAVTEDEIVSALRLLHTAAGLEVEPAAALGVAAIARAARDRPGLRAATIVTGANVTADRRRAAAPT